MAFDYGVPEDIIGTANHPVKQWPITGKMTGLLDADTIPYAVGYTSNFEEYLRFQNSKAPFESDIWKSKIAQASYLIDSCLSAAGCDSCIFYLTDSLNNFRLSIGKAKEYKGQRKEEKPPFFSELKEWIHRFHNAVMSDRCEADDEISIEAWKRHYQFKKESGQSNVFTGTHRRFIDFVIISKDKDLKIIPGLHHPPSSDKSIWVTPIGFLEPVYKEVQVKAYSSWPLFNGTALNPKHLFVLKQRDFGIFPETYANLSSKELKDANSGWEEKYLWCSMDTNLKMHEQDKFIRGKNKGQGKFKRVEVGTMTNQNIKKLNGAGLKFFYSQLLTGDSVDNYPGLPGYGPKKAFEILENCNSEQELASAVYREYISYYRSGDIANPAFLEQGQLAHLQTQRNELWDYPCIDKSTFPNWACAF